VTAGESFSGASHAGSCCCSPAPVAFSVAIMSGDFDGEDLISEVFAHAAETYDPGMARLLDLFARSIARWIQATADQHSAVDAYVLPWGAEVHVTVPAAQHAPGLHPTLPGQQLVRLLPMSPAWGGAIHLVWPTSMR
jgi:hypothetical protein